MNAGPYTLRGVAEALAGVDRVEYQHLMFGTIEDGNNYGDPGTKSPGESIGERALDQWSPASGRESWKVTTHLKKGDNRIRVRAVDKNGEVSLLKTVRILVQ
jgi:hypothetical protein